MLEPSNDMVIMIIIKLIRTMTITSLMIIICKTVMVMMMMMILLVMSFFRHDMAIHPRSIHRYAITETGLLHFLYT